MIDEMDILQKQYDETVDKFNSLVTEILDHEVPECVALRPAMKLVAKMAYVKNATKFLELFTGKY